MSVCASGVAVRVYSQFEHEASHKGDISEQTTDSWIHKLDAVVLVGKNDFD